MVSQPNLPHAGTGEKVSGGGDPRAASDSRAPTWRQAALVFLVALGYRLAYLFEASRQVDFGLFYMDQEYHLEWARAIVSGHWAPPFDVLQGAAFFRAPLYPYFLAAIFAVAGPNPSIARVVQMVIGSVSCVLVYAVATRVFGRRVGLLSGLLAALYWVLAYFDGELLIPVVLVVLVLAGFWLAMAAVERTSPALAAAGGLAFGLSSIARPNMLLFLPVVIAWMAGTVRRFPRRARAAFLVLFVVGCLGPALAVTVRNRVVAGDWVIVASQGGVNFYIGNNPQSDGMQAVVPGTSRSWWGGYDETVRIAEQVLGRELTASEVSSYWFGEALRFIREQPGAWARLSLRKALAYLGDVEIPNNEPYEARRGRFWTLRLVPLGFGLIFALSALTLPSMLHPRWSLRPRGDLRGRPDPRWAPLIVVFVVVYSATVVAFFVTGRYRLPVVPFVIMGAAATSVTLFDLARARAWARLLPALALVGVVGFALRLDPLDVRVKTRGFVELSDALDYIEAGRPLEAIPSLERLRAEGSVRLPEVYTTLVQLYLGRNAEGDRKRILDLVAEGLPLYPDDAELLWHATMANFEAGQLEIAQGFVTRYLRQRPDEVRGRYVAARIAAARGDRAGAVGHLRHAERVAPHDPHVAQLRALLGLR